MYFTYYNRPRRRWALINTATDLVEGYAKTVAMRDVRIARASQCHRREGFLGELVIVAGFEPHGGHGEPSTAGYSVRRKLEAALRTGSRQVKRRLRLDGRRVTDDLGYEVAAAQFITMRAPIAPEAPPFIVATGVKFRAPAPGNVEVRPIDWAAVPETQRAHGQCRHCGDPATYMRLRYRAGQLRSNSMAQYDALCAWHAGNVLAHAEAS